jgi:hypothetical protein
MYFEFIANHNSRGDQIGIDCLQGSEMIFKKRNDYKKAERLLKIEVFFGET